MEAGYPFHLDKGELGKILLNLLPKKAENL
jgi:hypothetical protein